MKWFGPTPFAPVCKLAQRTETPTCLCIWCDEPFTAEDCGLVLPFHTISDKRELAYHRECFLRQTVGSVGHQLRACPCYGGTEEDPPELSLREAARLACEMFNTTGGVVPPGGDTPH